MTKIQYLLILIIISGCSLNQNSKFWTKSEKINEDKDFVVKLKTEEIFKKNDVIVQEFNKDIKIKFDKNSTIEKKSLKYSNNFGRINFDGNLKKSSRFKYSKIDNFYEYEPELIFHNENVIFFDNNGTILNFTKDSKLKWRKNFYTRSEKKLNPILQFAKNEKYLIVADNIAKYFMLDIETGELIWSKYNPAPFNSQIKIFKDRFFIIDSTNTLRCISVKNGKEIWNLKTQNSLIRSQKKLSLVIVKNIIYFNNSVGDISAVDLQNGELLWQLPTQDSLIYESAFSLETSELISDGGNLYFSNNKNQFFSIDLNVGNFDWETTINSNLRPTIFGNIIFTISIEGFLFLIDKNNGNIIRTTDLFDNLKSNKRAITKPTGFILGKDKIYLSTNVGILFVIDAITGKTLKKLKIDNEKILRPINLNNYLFVVKDNAIIKLN